ncbi:hypothetical protein PIB30_102162 [Stylosanthes scabra]|uniref:Uncharacterized protein n=1 Tax=Stylosanthes scabra TaxID=79078 RepID=A0ABU6WX91_9FABA|nr:hypothetical protein [Stylosanthes scabra]
MQSRSEKGLCYWCDEKFSATHRCANRQLKLLQLELEYNVTTAPVVQDDSPVEDSMQMLEQQVLSSTKNNSGSTSLQNSLAKILVLDNEYVNHESHMGVENDGTNNFKENLVIGT